MNPVKIVFTGIAAFILLSCITLYAQFKADDLAGTWMTEDGGAKIRIFKCDKNYCGRIVWLKEPNRDGKPKLDRENPDDAQKSRPVMGLQMLWGFEFDGDDVWSGGYIYDPKSGKTYKCKITLTEEGKRIKVRGYIGISLIGRTAEWTRVQEDR